MSLVKIKNGQQRSDTGPELEEHRLCLVEFFYGHLVVPVVEKEIIFQAKINGWPERPKDRDWNFKGLAFCRGRPDRQRCSRQANEEHQPRNPPADWAFEDLDFEIRCLGWLV